MTSKMISMIIEALLPIYHALPVMLGLRFIRETQVWVKEKQCIVKKCQPVTKVLKNKGFIY